eukprot:SAG11_NODE_2511_length_3268_cov_4.738403_1_plen_76_part_10
MACAQRALSWTVLDQVPIATSILNLAGTVPKSVGSSSRSVRPHIRVWMNIIRPILYGKWVPGTGTRYWYQVLPIDL